MKDPEFAQAMPGFSPKSQVRSNFATKKVLAIIYITAAIVGVMFGIGMLASCFERSVNSHDQMHYASTALHQETDLGHSLVPREEDYDQGFIAIEAAPGSYTESEKGVKIPISTETSYETFYSFSKVEETVTRTLTRTRTVIATTASSSEEAECSLSVVTATTTSVETVIVIPTPTPANYATVTGEPSTVTDADTSISYTSDVPDATVPGDPLTRTNVQTDVSYTSGPPDATVSSNPSTVAEVDASYSQATRTTMTVTITDLWGVDTMTTITTPVIVTITNLYPPVPVETETSTEVSVTLTKPLYPTNGTSAANPTGRVPVTPIPPTPVVVVSGSSRKSEPHTWGTGNSSGNVASAFAVFFILIMI